MAEIIEEHLAQANYHFKVQTKQFWDTFGRLQLAWTSTKAERPAD